MLKKAINLLKTNPVLILFYAAVEVIIFLILFTMYPNSMKDFGITEGTMIDFSAYFMTLGKMLLAVLFLSVIGIIFNSGYGYMTAEAVYNGKTSAQSFLKGVKKYGVRVLLTTLLLTAMSFGVSIIIWILMFLFMMLSFVLGILGNHLLMTGIVTIVLSFLVILLVPFVLLWSPAIFIDDIGVIQGLKNGWRAGLKNYWRLFVALLLFYIPVGIAAASNSFASSNGDILTPGYWVACIIMAFISVLLMPYLFMVYYDYRMKTLQQGMELNEFNEIR